MSRTHLNTTPIFLDRLNFEYLKAQIETGNAGRTKKALQQLCKLYRDGFRIKPDRLSGMEQSIIGLIYTHRTQEKIRRWALNALARLGREQNCLEAIKHVLQDFTHEPQTMAAAIAATYKMSRQPSQILKDVDYDPQLVTLAALQHAHPDKIDMTSLPINIENATAEALKLALLVVGLDRAPSNLLNPRHTNAEMVKALGGHHDPIVSQYTVWAITENPFLGVDDLGIAIQDIEQQPANVRAWMFQLIAMNPSDAERLHEYIVLGVNDPDSEAKVGLASGLKDTFFDGLQTTVIDWFVSEGDVDVSLHLIDHMVRQSRYCGAYKNGP